MAELSRETLELASAAIDEIKSSDETSPSWMIGKYDSALGEIRAALGESSSDETPSRLTRLIELADRCLGIYDERVSDALESGRVPRYALMTSEGSTESSYADNPNLTLHDTTDELALQIAGELEEGWAPWQVIDLETGADIGYTVRVEIESEDN
jgi:hypothetical protein